MTPDGLFIDIWLGDGTAFELHAWLQEHHPALAKRVVFVSGDVPGDTTGPTPTALGCPVLGKPLDVPAIKAELKELAALGAFRQLFHAGLDAAFSGAPLAALLGRNCFGGFGRKLATENG